MVAISYNTLAFVNQNLAYVPNTPSEWFWITVQTFLKRICIRNISMRIQNPTKCTRLVMVYLLALHGELWFAYVSVAWYDLLVGTASFYFYWFLSWCFAYNWCSGNCEKKDIVVCFGLFYLKKRWLQCRPGSNADCRHSKSAGSGNFSVH